MRYSQSCLNGHSRKRKALLTAILKTFELPYKPRLQVVSNFRDSGEIHARARKWAPARRRATVARLLAGAHFRARVCISPELRKLETTRSLIQTLHLHIKARKLPRTLSRAAISSTFSFVSKLP